MSFKKCEVLSGARNHWILCSPPTPQFSSSKMFWWLWVVQRYVLWWINKENTRDFPMAPILKISKEIFYSGEKFRPDLAEGGTRLHCCLLSLFFKVTPFASPWHTGLVCTVDTRATVDDPVTTSGHGSEHLPPRPRAKVTYNWDMILSYVLASYLSHLLHVIEHW